MKIKRLFFDIETSYNKVASWNLGEVFLDHNCILDERAIICICYKWEGSKTVHSLEWNKGDDKKMLQEFVKIMNEADEIIGHNSDSFDIKWIRGRCLYHRISMFPEYKTVDTLKFARTFKVNSKRLDYLGKYLGVGQKVKTGGFDMWKNIVERNSSKDMKEMIKYCKQDVNLLEKVYHELSKYVKSNTHVGVLIGNSKCSCKACGSENYQISKYRVSASGLKSVQLQCKDCNRYFTVSEAVFEANSTS